MIFQTNIPTRITDEEKTTRPVGFTLVELVIAIVVIAILATLVVVVYSSTLKRANADSLQSDLRSFSSAVEAYKVAEKKYPATINDVNQGSGVTTAEGNTLTYTADANGEAFCAQVQGNGMSYFVTESSSVPATGTCSGFVGVPGSGAEVTPAADPRSGMVITTLAGSTYGFADGTGAAAQFSYPAGVAVDGSGTIYVADSYNHRIRKITQSGVVTTLAGSTQGFADGTGAAAQFSAPSDLAIDAAGTIYVADTNNHRIRKITQSGVVTTLAGSTQGFADGTGAAALFNRPTGITSTSAGNLYVSDRNNHRIRKVSQSGVVTTLAGSSPFGSVDGTGTAAKFSYPRAIVLDSVQNAYVADSTNHRIRKITPSGVVTTLAGSTSGYADGTGTAAQFNNPSGIVIDASGNLYVSDRNNNRIRKVTQSGVVTTLAGSSQGYADGNGLTALFYYPEGLAIDTYGNMYLADLSNNRIRKIQQF